MVRAATMGGTMAVSEIASFNQDVSPICTYCNEEVGAATRIRWECSHFEAERRETDPQLAAVLRKYLIESIKCGIAPAMKAYPNKTYWGTNVDEDEEEDIKKLLGIDHSLDKLGPNADVTDEREQAIQIIQQGTAVGLNARQIMLTFKEANGSGTDPSDFPSFSDIDQNMAGHAPDYKADIFGDGSLTSPTVWWAALGGYGYWIPDWNLHGQRLADRMEQDHVGPALGQKSSSTRHEL